MLEPALYLIPVTLSDGTHERVLPQFNVQVIREIRHFVVENVRTARRFLKACDRAIDIDKLTFSELNGHTRPEDVEAMLAPLADGEAVGLMSEAGCPAVADPGADLVSLAQRRGYVVRPLVGPSSILLGLMASGFNGQRFAFEGYLPIEAGARSRRLKEMVRRIEHEDQTQIFIETPYRNDRLVEELCRVLPPSLRLCVATDLTGAGEHAVTRTIAQWRKLPPQSGKVPTIYLLYK
ncbi:MAG: SAM-dependent methyltransferase [Muribaculaceae bacterium]|nr:SAM-dependent methyltransferase [Muribaculaceae bacterium]